MSDFAPRRPAEHGSPEPGVRIRPAAQHDLSAVRALTETRGPVPAHFTARLTQRLADPAWTVMIASPDSPSDGRGDPDVAVSGWAMVGPWPGGDGAPDGRYVSALTVHPRARRRGIGGRLLSALLSSESGPVFSVVNAQNRASWDLHRRHGFVELARAARFAGIDFDGGSGVLLRRD